MAAAPLPTTLSVSAGGAEQRRASLRCCTDLFVWTCNKDTKEQAYNDGSVVAIMRITDLKA